MENDDKDKANTESDQPAPIAVTVATVPESVEAEAEVAAETEAEPAKPERPSAVPRAVALFALLVAMLSAAAAGFLWWQYRQFYVELNDTDAANQLGLRQARTEIVALEDKLADLREDDRKLRAEIVAAGEAFAYLPPRLVDLEERLQSVQGVSENSRRAWLRAEVQYLLSLANTELALAKRWDTARQALTLADAKLRELGNPSLTPVREAIETALQRLNAIPVADSEGLSLALGSLANRVDELPLAASSARSEFETTPSSIDEPPGLERAWASLKAALGGLVRIEKRDTPVRRALTMREEALLRLKLELELEAARLSLLRADGAGFTASVLAAQHSLTTDFDGSDPGVRAALGILTGMAAVAIDPPRPDISQPLLLMQQLTDTNREATQAVPRNPAPGGEPLPSGEADDGADTTALPPPDAEL